MQHLNLLRQYVRLQTLFERRMREVDVSDGTKVPRGSQKHIDDLKARINSLTMWRDKQKRGSEARANYSRIISRLKGELSSAQRFLEKKHVNENYATEPDPEDVERWEKTLNNKTSDRYVNQVIDSFENATSIDELDAAREDVNSKRASGHVSSILSGGFVDWMYAKNSKRLGAIVRKLR